MESGACHWPVTLTMPTSVTKITTIRMSVARSALIAETPTLPKIAVSAAKAADSKAYESQEAVPVISVARRTFS